MKRVVIITVICTYAFVTAPAIADMMVNLKTNFTGRNGTTNGGEFLITVLQDPIGIYDLNEQFRTFCIETNRYIGNNQNYYVTIDTMAWIGGSGGGNPDPLSAETAYLYSLWLDGTDGVNNILHNDTTADAMQRAIWYSEGETLGSNAGLSGTYLSWANDAVTVGGSNDSWYNKWGNTIGDIRVMNLWTNVNHTGDAQDQLVRVPLPGAVLLGVLGLCIAGVKLRKFA
ncbi:MAG: hypothetical protein GY845_06410 [Planctomycetes bacterium]|nr:hypothetical protein [Planctomycetota bacterium]